MQITTIRTALFLAASCALSAATIATNYTGIDSGGFGLGFGNARAVQFTAGFTGYVTGVDVWINAQGPGNTAYLDTYLLADAGGLPGGVLEHIGNVQGAQSSAYALANGLASGNTLLQAGTKYWIGGTLGAGSDVAIAWGNGGTLLLEATAPSGGVNGAWSIAGGNSTAVQFQINGNPATAGVPEPSTFALTGLTGFALIAARRRRATRES